MKCIEVEELLGLYADGILSQEEKAMVDNHIRECKECRRQIKDMQGLLEGLHNLGAVPLPEDLKDRIYASLQADFTSKVKAEKAASTNQGFACKGWRVLAGVAAAVLLAVGIGAGIMQAAENKSGQDSHTTAVAMLDKIVKSKSENTNFSITHADQESIRTQKQAANSEDRKNGMKSAWQESGVQAGATGGREKVLSRGKTKQGNIVFSTASEKQEKHATIEANKNRQDAKQDVVEVSEDSGKVPMQQGTAADVQAARTLAAPAAPSTALSITVDGITIANILKRDGKIYVPVFPLADALGIPCQYEDDGAGKQLILNGIPENVFSENEELYLDIDTFCMLTGTKYVWDPETGEIVVSKN